MIDQRLLRTDLDGVMTALGRRLRPAILEDVEESARLDTRLREITAERDAIRARVNTISKEVGQLRRDGNVEAAEALQVESRSLGESEKRLAAEHDELAATLNNLLLGIPNIPHLDAPDGTATQRE